MIYRSIFFLLMTCFWYCFGGALKKETIRVAVLNDFPPLYMVDQNKKPYGLAIDLLDIFLKENKIAVSYVKCQNWEEATDAIRERRADCIPGIGFDQKRVKEFYYSKEMETVPVCLFVRTSNTTIESMDDLNGKVIAVIAGSVAATEIETKYKQITAEKYETIEAAVFSLMAGHVDAFLFPEPVLRKKLIEVGLTKRIKVIGNPVIELKRGYMFRKEDSLYVRDIVNPFIEKIVDDKKYGKIYFKWYGLPYQGISITNILIYTLSVIILLAIIFIVIWIITIQKINSRLTVSLRNLEKTKKELAESENRYRILSETSPFGIAVVNLVTLEIKFVNRTFCDMFGYKKDEIYTLTVKDLHPPQTVNEVGIVFENAKNSDSDNVVVNVHDCLRKDGQRFTCRVHASQMSIDSDKCLVGFFVDITEENKLQETQRQTEKLLSIGQLAGGVAHDFNNQLAGIMGYCDLLLEGIEEENELYQYVGKMITIVNRSSDLTRQLLAFARKGKYTEQIVNINGIVDEVVNLLKHSIDKKITVSSTILAQDVCILGDPSQIQNAILNLALNARDAIQGTGEITIVTENLNLGKADCDQSGFEINPGKFICVSVIDTGSGMSKEVRDHLFEPFFTTKEKGKGTGMGLAAVYGTVRNHQGAIRVNSEEGYGTTITILLPVVVEESKASGNLFSAQKVEKRSSGIGVMVVDDEGFVRDIALKILEQKGYCVKAFENGVEALGYYRENYRSIQIVILDMVMPLMDGKETFLAMKSINKDIVAILSSGYSRSSAVQSIIDEGIKGFIQKPFRKQQLLEMIESVTVR